MPEKHDLLAVIPCGKGTRHRATLRFFCNGVPSRQIMAACLQNSNRRNDVRHYRLVHSVTLDFAGLSSNLRLYNERCIYGIGTDSIGSLIKRFAAKKAGVEDGRNQ